MDRLGSLNGSRMLTFFHLVIKEIYSQSPSVLKPTLRRPVAPDRAQIKMSVENAQLFVVIGFGFHRQNIQIVKGSTASTRVPIFVTVYGVAHYNHEAIKV